jgi:hypothetical protein
MEQVIQETTKEMWAEDMLNFIEKNKITKIEELKHCLKVNLINTTEQVLEHLKSIDWFNCSLRYEFESYDNHYHLSSYCDLPNTDSEVEFDFDEYPSSYYAQGTIDGTATISSKDIIKLIASDDDNKPPKTYDDLKVLIEKMICEYSSDGEIEVLNIREFSDKN